MYHSSSSCVLAVTAMKYLPVLRSQRYVFFSMVLYDTRVYEVKFVFLQRSETEISKTHLKYDEVTAKMQ